MNGRRAKQLRRAARPAATPPVMPVPATIVCLRCRRAYQPGALIREAPHACQCVHPIPSADGRTPLSGVPSAQQRYEQIIREVVS